jgi:hypothetical protein
MGAELDAGGFGRGERAEKHDRERHRSTQVRGSRKEITPLLLLYWFILGSMEYTTRLLPSSLLEEEDELKLSSIQRETSQPLPNPLLGTPVPPYIVVARVTTVM